MDCCWFLVKRETVGRRRRRLRLLTFLITRRAPLFIGYNYDGRSLERRRLCCWDLFSLSNEMFSLATSSSSLLCQQRPCTCVNRAHLKSLRKRMSSSRRRRRVRRRRPHQTSTNHLVNVRLVCFSLHSNFTTVVRLNCNCVPLSLSALRRR